MSFYCPHCHFKNSEIQSAGAIQPKGARYTFTLASAADFSRQVIKGERCTAKFAELDIEIPPGRGQITNVESLLRTTIDDLAFAQPTRRGLDEDVYNKIEALISRGRAMLDGVELPVTLLMDDPTGNSLIQPSPDNMDHRWTRVDYERSPEQNEALMLQGTSDAADEESGVAQPGVEPVPDFKKAFDAGASDDIVPDEVYSFPASCPGCARPCTTHMKMVDIPHFKEVIIMSTVCHHCGYRSNEVKTGGTVPSQGRRITLRVEDAEDLARDILKSESCAFSCPELKLSVNPGTLGGRFTTVEGLLTQIRDNLNSQVFDVADVGQRSSSSGHDSMPAQEKKTWEGFFAGLDSAIKAERKFTVILEDPLASSYVQNLYAPDPDPQLTIQDYERTDEENEDLGLNDIKTEGYEEDGKGGQGKPYEATGTRATGPGDEMDKPPKADRVVDEAVTASGPLQP